jgi:hypothetical protein
MSDVQTLQARLTALKTAVASTPPDAREALLREREEVKLALEAALARARDAKDAEAARNRMRNFAGLGTPLHEALVARFPPDVVAELEAAAEAGQMVRDQRAAERRAAKAAKEPPPAAPAPPKSTVTTTKPQKPEVYYARKTG